MRTGPSVRQHDLKCVAGLERLRGAHRLPARKHYGISPPHRLHGTGRAQPKGRLPERMLARRQRAAHGRIHRGQHSGQPCGGAFSRARRRLRLQPLLRRSQAQTLLRKLMRKGRVHPPQERLLRLQQRPAFRHGQLSGGRGRGCAHVGHKIRDRHIGFVSHGADHRGMTACDSARHHLFIEGPQVLHAAAATVLSISMAMVILPTPPGTGVI